MKGLRFASPVDQASVLIGVIRVNLRLILLGELVFHYAAIIQARVNVGWQ
jgi:hypothetical protein